MSKIAERIGSRYNSILAHFVRNPFGSFPPDMTVLSLLPPIDRVLILERLFALRAGNVLDLVDKLSMAYLKSGRDDLAYSFVRACVAGGWIIPEHGQFFLDKLVDLPVYGVSLTYEDTLHKLPQYEGMSPALADLLHTLCTDYANHEVYAGLSSINAQDVADRLAFDSERAAFIHAVAG